MGPQRLETGVVAQHVECRLKVEHVPQYSVIYNVNHPLEGGERPFRVAQERECGRARIAEHVLAALEFVRAVIEHPQYLMQQPGRGVLPSHPAKYLRERNAVRVVEVGFLYSWVPSPVPLRRVIS